MVRQLALQSALDEGFGELLQQTVLAQKILGAVAVLQQLVNELGVSAMVLTVPVPFNRGITLQATYTK